MVCPCRGSSEHLATVLRAALAAGQAAGTLVGAVGLHSPRLMAAVRGLVELLPWEPARRAALCAIALPHWRPQPPPGPRQGTLVDPSFLR